MTDETKPEPTPAKVHGDGGTSGVVAETVHDEAEDIEASEDADVRRIEEADRKLKAIPGAAS